MKNVGTWTEELKKLGILYPTKRMPIEIMEKEFGRNLTDSEYTEIYIWVGEDLPVIFKYENICRRIYVVFQNGTMHDGGVAVDGKRNIFLYHAEETSAGNLMCFDAFECSSTDFMYLKKHEWFSEFIKVLKDAEDSGKEYSVRIETIYTEVKEVKKLRKSEWHKWASVAKWFLLFGW